MTSGEWQCAPHDQGALVNSDPLHWPLILNWLSFGAVPDASSVSSAFLTECRYWQLDRLLEQLEAAEPPATPAAVLGSSVMTMTEAGLHNFSLRGLDAANGHCGFILEGHFCIVYCIVLYCIVLYCIVLYCIVLYCIVLYCIVLYCIVLYCIVLYCIVLYCIVLYCIVLYCIVYCIFFVFL